MAYLWTVRIIYRTVWKVAWNTVFKEHFIYTFFMLYGSVEVVMETIQIWFHFLSAASV
jgi:hypothetical protein